MPAWHPPDQPNPNLPAHGTVVVFPCYGYGDRHDHEVASCRVLAEKLAAIKHFEFAGEYDSGRRYSSPLYFVPSDTLVGIDFAHGQGIRDQHDLFGGVVPFPFVATKTITHPLVAGDANAPHGWSAAFGSRTRDVVLPGFSAFSRQDARSAGVLLLAQGRLRIKKATGAGGVGQWVVSEAHELDARLATIDAEEIARYGLVLERNLSEVTTHSVGQVRVGSILATYYGTQRLTPDNSGAEVYGGSDLTVMRGDYDALLRLDFPREVQAAIAQARTYHAAAFAEFPGMFASRCNYDIACGRDDRGEWHSGVLEQSWRIGGASGAELAALEAFSADAALNVVRASTTEIYGPAPALPADATVYFRGTDQSAGPITKYARLEADAHP